MTQRVSQLLPLLKSAYLLSLYDVWYLDELRGVLSVSDDRVRIWDSGGYETRFSDDVSAAISAVPGSSEWDTQRYIEAARHIPWNGKDILVSFDNTEQTSVEEQLDIAFSCYEQIDGNYIRDLLLHISTDYDVNELARKLLPYLSKFEIIGLTEKEIAPTWKQGVRFAHSLDQAFERLGQSPPHIHLFGCLDPKSVIYFALAGVSIFDGLSWLRYFFHERTTLYRREYEFIGDFQGISPSLDIDTAITHHNIREMEELRSDLIYQSVVADNTLFSEEKRILQDILANS